MDADALLVEDVPVTGNRLLIEGPLDLTEESEYDLFYIRFRRIGAAVEVLNDETTFRISSPCACCERRLVERQSGP